MKKRLSEDERVRKDLIRRVSVLESKLSKSDSRRLAEILPKDEKEKKSFFLKKNLYENKLKQGQYLSYDECYNVKKKMLNKHWTNKMFKAMVPNKMYNIDMLKKDFGLNTDERWQVALSRIGENDTIKITIQFLSNEVRSDALNIKVFKNIFIINNYCFVIIIEP